MLPGLFLFIYLFVCLFWLLQVLVLACGIFVETCRIFSCSTQTSSLWPADFLVAACMRDLVPRPEIKTRPPALQAWSFIHWTTRKIPEFFFLKIYLFIYLFIILFWLHWVLVVLHGIFTEACRIFLCGTRASL